MALSQAQWLAKLKSWVPDWYFQTSHYNEAIFSGWALVFSEVQQNADQFFAQTLITESEDEYLDLHGFERGFFRLPLEINPSYAKRVQSLLNQSNPPAIEDLVNSVLIVGTCTIREHGFGDIICLNRGSFLNRSEVYTDSYYNTFTIIVDEQIHAPYSFLSRGCFFDRSNFFGTSQSDVTVFDLILQIVNNVKAAGTLYRVLERN